MAYNSTVAFILITMIVNVMEVVKTALKGNKRFRRLINETPVKR